MWKALVFFPTPNWSGKIFTKKKATFPILVLFYLYREAMIQLVAHRGFIERLDLYILKGPNFGDIGFDLFEKRLNTNAALAFYD